MTGPNGEKSHGWWRLVALDEPRSLEFEDGFADEHGTPSADMPATTARVELEKADGGTRMTIVSRFPSIADMERLLSMGMAEGLAQSVGQIDDVLLACV